MQKEIKQKKKILLVPDVPNWAWDHKANALMKNLKYKFDFDKIYSNQFKAHLLQEYDSIHFFGWMEAYQFVSFGTAGISSHNFEVKHFDVAKRILPQFKAITAVSRILYNRLKELQMNKNIYLCENGVDTELFVPNDIQVPEKKLVIGWIGQQGGQLDQHGYHKILVPLKRKIEQRSDMRIRIIDRIYTNAMPHHEMVKFYQTIDVLLHTGYMTGTPNPIFEAASCSKAVISTKIGVAPDMIQDGINGFLIDLFKLEDDAEQTINSFIEKLKILKDKNLCSEFGKKSREIVEKSWTWKEKAKQWIPVFENYRSNE